MKYKVTVSALFIAGQKYRRGDVVDLSEQAAATFGTRLEVIAEAPVEEKPKPARKPKAKKAAAK
jgi:hypothetical protein